ncbi:olfactory receptor 10G4-like [Arapaima gigas]
MLLLDTSGIPLPNQVKSRYANVRDKLDRAASHRLYAYWLILAGITDRLPCCQPVLKYSFCDYGTLIVYRAVRLADGGGRKHTSLNHAIVLFAFYFPKLITVLLTRVGVSLDLTERNALLVISTLMPALVNPAVYCLRTKEIRNQLT